MITLRRRTYSHAILHSTKDIKFARSCQKSELKLCKSNSAQLALKIHGDSEQ